MSGKLHRLSDLDSQKTIFIRCYNEGNSSICVKVDVTTANTFIQTFL